MLDAYFLDSGGYFNTKHLSYITHIFENTYDPRFHLWATQKYKEVKEFIKKPYIFYNYVMQPEEIITYGYLFQEAISEYHKIFTSKQWEPTDIKEKSQDVKISLNFSTGEIEETVIKTANKYYFKILKSGK